MNAQPSFRPTSRYRSTAFRHLFVALASCGMVGASITGCVAAQPYNPDNLGEPQFTRVGDICQTVMGLSPQERLSGGDWRGDTRLDYLTSHYRGCVLSLSDSVQSVGDAQIAKRAHEECSAKGYQPQSPDLALCVLQSVNSQPYPPASQSSGAVATPVSSRVTPASGSLFYASGHETVRREQVACAALGLEPAQGGFERCVKELDATLDAIDNPVN